MSSLGWRLAAGWLRRLRRLRLWRIGRSWLGVMLQPAGVMAGRL